MKKYIDYVNNHLLSTIKYVQAVLKWGICSVIIGVICGVIGTLFYEFVKAATDIRTDFPQFIYSAPVVGLFIVFIYSKFKMLDDGGTNAIISSIRSSEKVPLKMTILIFVSTVLTHLCGGSSGREGAALQIGGSMGSTIGNILKMDENGMRILTMCGMSSVFAALFGTPLTATIFSMEVISVGVLYYVAFIPCIISSVIAYGIAAHFGMKPEFFVIKGIPELSVTSVSKVILLSALCAGLSILFCVTIHKISIFYKKHLKSPYFRAFVGGCLIIVITLLLGCYDYNGAGMNIVAEAIDGEAKPMAFLIKMLFTAITLGAGFKGGEIVPSFFIGATFGCIAGNLIGLPASFGAALGLVALFCGVVNCPISALLLSVELFGSEGIILFGINCAISYTLSGYYGLYSSQKIIYSKLNPTFVNRGTK